jgi:hypothetical protein
MKKMKYTKSSISLCVFAVFFSCKKEQPALTKMDCSCAKEVSADFLIEEIYAYGYNWEKRTETDTCFGDRNVSFKALEENADYTWYLGSEILNTREVVRYFAVNSTNQKIPISLVVKKKANLICYPNDDGYDSVTKYLVVNNKIMDSDQLFIDTNYMFEGVFRMKERDGVDSVDITIDLYWGGWMSGGTLRIYNFDGMGSNSPMDYYGGFIAVNYRQLWYRHNLRRNMIHNRLDGVVELNMVQLNNITPVKSYYYLGRKL